MVKQEKGESNAGKKEDGVILDRMSEKVSLALKKGR